MKLNNTKRRTVKGRFCILIRNLCYLSVTLHLLYLIKSRLHSRTWRTTKFLQRHTIINSNQLVNMKNFKYKIKPNACNITEDLISLIIVTSNPFRYNYRKAIRTTWGKHKKDFKIKIIFAIGESLDDMTRKLIFLEHKIHGDILQGNFVDSIRNETLKHVMGLKWSIFYCPNARFVIKTSDDTFIVTKELKNILMHHFWKEYDDNLMACKVNKNEKVQRKKTHVYYVSEQEYRGTVYPAYCNGVFIIYSPETAARVVAASQVTNYFYLDTVYVNGILRKNLQLDLTDVSDLMLSPKMYRAFNVAGDENLGEFLVGPPGITPDGIERLCNFIESVNGTFTKQEDAMIENNSSRKLNFRTDYENGLVDLKRFKFQINTKVCNNRNNISTIIVVPSSPCNYLKRQALRNTWSMDGDFFKAVFLLGETNDEIYNKLIETENEIHEDIVQGNFVDAYRNMTYKHIMGLKWANEYCAKAKFILKVDDDIFVNVEQLNVMLKNLSSEQKDSMIACRVNNRVPVSRNKHNKWYVSKDEYAGDHFTKYCSGSFILYNQRAAKLLVNASETTRYFYVDDFYVTGLLTNKLNINLTDIRNYYLNPQIFNKAVAKGYIEQDFVYGPINFQPHKIQQLWNLTKVSIKKKKRNAKKIHFTNKKMRHTDKEGSKESTEFLRSNSNNNKERHLEISWNETARRLSTVINGRDSNENVYDSYNSGRKKIRKFDNRILDNMPYKFGRRSKADDQSWRSRILKNPKWYFRNRNTKTKSRYVVKKQ